MKTGFLILFLAVLPLLSQAQQTKIQTETAVDTLLPSNEFGRITALRIRNALKSILNYADPNNLTTGSIALSKLAQSGATGGQVLKWNGSAWIPGTEGIVGAQGPMGQNGSQFFFGSADPTNELTSGTQIGDYYVDNINGSVWRRQANPDFNPANGVDLILPGANWEVKANLKGPVGPQGSAGVLTEVDPTVAAHIKAISAGNITAWNNAVSGTINNNIIYQSNFAVNEAEVNFWVNGGSTHSRSGGQLVITSVDDAIGFGDETKFKEGQLIHVFIDFVKTGGDVIATCQYGGFGASSVTLKATGRYFFTLKRPAYSYPISGYNIFLLQPINGVKSFTLNSLSITDGGTGFDVNGLQVKIGVNTEANYNSVVIGKDAKYTATYLDGVVIGAGARSDTQNGVVIGGLADGNHDATYGTSAGSDLVAIGYKAKSYGWRNTAIGASAGAAGQSSTAFGAGAFAGLGHSVAFGRGGYIMYTPPFGTGKLYNGHLLSAEVNQIYFGNGWAHRYKPHPVNDVEYGVNSDSYYPSNNAVVLHGLDAYDDRETPASFNIAGGDIAIMSGRGTGTGVSGRVQLLTSPPSGVGQNEKNPAVVGLEIDASTNPYDGTRLLLYDLYNSTLKRVKLAPPDGSGRMMLYIDN